MLKDELQTRRVNIEAEIVIFRRNHTVERNLKKQYQRIRSSERIEKGGQTSIGRQWSSVYKRNNLYSKQLKDLGTNPIEKS